MRSPTATPSSASSAAAEWLSSTSPTTSATTPRCPQGPPSRACRHFGPARLKIDPTFDPLRKNPRFQKLVEGSGT
jgi:hypothetical protein